MSTSPTATTSGRMPRQIPFIIGSEGCERFSFYGMRNILKVFLASSLFLYMPKGDRDSAAVEVFHTFVAGVYFFPLLGGWLSDRFFGKFRTVLWFSVIYCIGQGCLSAFSYNEHGFYAGLFLVALGSGGIKPLVASFVGDQFDATNKHLGKIVFDAFYWIINFGSFFASLLMPWFLDDYGPRFAFAIPGVLMVIATAVFYAGKDRFVIVPPPPQDPNSFLRVIRTALLSPGPRFGLVLAGIGIACALASPLLIARLDLVPALGLGLVLLIGLVGFGASLQLDRALGKHPVEAVEGVRAVLRILIVFAFVTPFWSLFDQKASTWIVQAESMSKPSWFRPAQMQLLNPALVMLLIPFNNLVLFPWLRRRGWEPTTLRRMTTGIALAGVAYIIVGTMQIAMDRGNALSIMWQILPYCFLTMGEVLVSATGLEFAYSQAPLAMKGAIMSFWSLCVTIGNLWVLLAQQTVQRKDVIEQIKHTGLSPTAFQMFFFAAFAGAAALAFGLYARRYKMTDNYRA